MSQARSMSSSCCVIERPSNFKTHSQDTHTGCCGNIESIHDEKFNIHIDVLFNYTPCAATGHYTDAASFTGSSLGYGPTGMKS